MMQLAKVHRQIPLIIGDSTMENAKETVSKIHRGTVVNLTFRGAVLTKVAL